MIRPGFKPSVNIVNWLLFVISMLLAFKLRLCDYSFVVFHCRLCKSELVMVTIRCESYILFWMLFVTDSLLIISALYFTSSKLIDWWRSKLSCLFSWWRTFERKSVGSSPGLVGSVPTGLKKLCSQVIHLHITLASLWRCCCLLRNMFGCTDPEIIKFETNLCASISVSFSD